MQTVVLKVTVTADPAALVAWAKKQKGICCDEPIHSLASLDNEEPELAAMGIYAHAKC